MLSTRGNWLRTSCKIFRQQVVFFFLALFELRKSMSRDCITSLKSHISLFIEKLLPFLIRKTAITLFK